MKIVWEQSAYIGNAPVFCTICGRQSYPIRGRRNELLLAVLYDQHDVVCGEVCRDCASADGDEIRERLQERIAALQTKISELQGLAAEPIHPPSLEQEFQVHRQDVL